MPCYRIDLFITVHKIWIELNWNWKKMNWIGIELKDSESDLNWNWKILNPAWIGLELNWKKWIDPSPDILCMYYDYFPKYSPQKFTIIWMSTLQCHQLHVICNGIWYRMSRDLLCGTENRCHKFKVMIFGECPGGGGGVHFTTIFPSHFNFDVHFILLSSKL